MPLVILALGIVLLFFLIVKVKLNSFLSANCNIKCDKILITNLYV